MIHLLTIALCFLVAVYGSVQIELRPMHGGNYVLIVGLLVFAFFIGLDLIAQQLTKQQRLQSRQKLKQYNHLKKTKSNGTRPH